MKTLYIIVVICILNLCNCSDPGVQSASKILIHKEFQTLLWKERRGTFINYLSWLEKVSPDGVAKKYFKDLLAALALSAKLPIKSKEYVDYLYRLCKEVTVNMVHNILTLNIGKTTVDILNIRLWDLVQIMTFTPYLVGNNEDPVKGVQAQLDHTVSEMRLTTDIQLQMEYFEARLMDAVKQLGAFYAVKPHNLEVALNQLDDAQRYSLVAKFENLCSVITYRSLVNTTCTFGMQFVIELSPIIKEHLVNPHIVNDAEYIVKDYFRQDFKAVLTKTYNQATTKAIADSAIKNLLQYFKCFGNTLQNDMVYHQLGAILRLMSREMGHHAENEPLRMNTFFPFVKDAIVTICHELLSAYQLKAADINNFMQSIIAVLQQWPEWFGSLDNEHIPNNRFTILNRLDAKVECMEDLDEFHYNKYFSLRIFTISKWITRKNFNVKEERDSIVLHLIKVNSLIAILRRKGLVHIDIGMLNTLIELCNNIILNHSKYTDEQIFSIRSTFLDLKATIENPQAIQPQ